MQVIYKNIKAINIPHRALPGGLPDMALPYRTGTMARAGSSPMNVQYITFTQTSIGSPPPGKVPQAKLLAHQREASQALPPKNPQNVATNTPN